MPERATCRKTRSEKSAEAVVAVKTTKGPIEIFPPEERLFGCLLLFGVIDKTHDF